jgi:hypothetical protein
MSYLTACRCIIAFFFAAALSSGPVGNAAFYGDNTIGPSDFVTNQHHDQGAPPIAEPPADKPALTLHVSDFGISQDWVDDPLLVRAFHPKQGELHSVFDNDAAGMGRLVVMMPADKTLEDVPAQRLKELIAARLRDDIKRQMAAGKTEFEIQLVQNIKDVPRYLLPDRQQKAAQFGRIAYGVRGGGIVGHGAAATGCCVAA